MKFALAGNPNCGKTTLFNSLTGSTAHVGNWPGVTVDKREGSYKKLAEKVQIVDLPGIYSLSPYTPEEIVSRNFILDERPDCIVNIVDATNLERNLYLTTQLLEIDLPVVVALNMMDAVEQNGDSIDTDALEKRLGVPVVPISALKGKNTRVLMERAYESARRQRKGFSVLTSGRLGRLVSAAEAELAETGIENPLFHAVKLVEGDSLETERYPAAAKSVAARKAEFAADEFGGDFEAAVADQRYQYISEHFARVLKKAVRKEGMTKSDRIDRVLTHRIWSIPIFLIIMLLVFHCTFSENFLLLKTFGVDISGSETATAIFWPDAEAKAEDILGGAEEESETVAGAEETAAEEESEPLGIPSPGVFLQSWLGYLTDGLLIPGVTLGLENAGAAEWVTGLLCDGLLSGLSAILSFLPQILLLFLFLSILEDSGYMARVAFIMDRAFRKFGLSGKAFMPLLMCFGCAVPGIMATKTLENEKERRLSIYLAPFFSCGAKLPIWLAFAAVMFAGQFGTLVVYSMYLIGIVVAILAAILLKATALKGDTPPFIMELPAYHRPQFKNTMVHLWDKLKHYLVKAATIIAGSIVVIWFLSNFGFAFWRGLVDIEDSIIGQVGNVIKYLFYPLGFAQGAEGWKFVVAAFTGLVAKENVVGTLEVLSSGAGLDAFLSALSNPAAYSFMVFNLLSVPCMAAVAAASGELQSGKKLWGAVGFWLATSYIVSAVFYWFGTLCEIAWWAGLLVGVAVAALIVTLILLRAKGILRGRKKAECGY